MMLLWITYVTFHLIGTYYLLTKSIIFVYPIELDDDIFCFCCRFQAQYASKLPQSITGEEFMETYGDHGDSVTTIDRKGTYHIMAPTKHPIYENFRVQVCLI